MIIRVWSCRVRPGKIAEFEAFCRAEAFPLMWSHRGLVALHCGRGRATTGENPDYILVSVWEDLPSLIAFTGERWQDPVVLPQEAELLDGIPDIRHYERL